MEAQLEGEQSAKQTVSTRLNETQLELDVMCASLKLARREAETHVLHLEGVEKNVKVGLCGGIGEAMERMFKKNLGI